MNKNQITLLFVLLVFLEGCTDYTPRPRGYFRIELKKKEYAVSQIQAPYQFEYPENIAKIVPHKGGDYWIDIVYPGYNAKIYCSYKAIHNNFYEISEDSRAFVYKHAIKADAITQQPFENKNLNMYGILYEIKGNTASSVQFILTDSTKHFFRGALYFNNRPNKDSIAPVVSYIKEDIVRIMETMKWK